MVRHGHSVANMSPRSHPFFQTTTPSTRYVSLLPRSEVRTTATKRLANGRPRCALYRFGPTRSSSLRSFSLNFSHIRVPRLLLVHRHELLLCFQKYSDGSLAFDAARILAAGASFGGANVTVSSCGGKRTCNATREEELQCNDRPLRGRDGRGATREPAEHTSFSSHVMKLEIGNR